MSIQDEIINWSKSQPTWRQNAIAKVARGQTIDDAEIRSIASALVENNVTLISNPIELHDLPSGAVVASRVALSSVGDLENVNALKPGHTLTFGGTGLTIVYGDNASGKSGYARLLKSAVGARHDEPVLPNAFDAEAGNLQSATISYAIDDDAHVEKWPVLSSSALRQIHFYDEACGRLYIDSDSEVSYRLSILQVFDDLSELSDRVGAELDRLLAQSQSEALALPRPDLGTSGAAFIEKFSRSTSDAEIEGACALPDDAEEQIARAIDEENRLRATNPEAEKRRLLVVSSSLRQLASGLKEIDRLLASTAQTSTTRAIRETADLRSAANLASSQGFSDEPLAGVGSAAWRTLWDAAEAYVRSDVPSMSEFPATAPTDRCPLCQQELAEAGGDRLRRFHAFVHNETEQKAVTAETGLNAIRNDITDLVTSSTDWSAATAYLEASDKPHADAISQTLSRATDAKSVLLQRLAGKSDIDLVDVTIPDVAVLEALAASLTEKANTIDSTVFQQQLAAAERAKKELQSRQILARSKGNLLKERDRLVQHKKVQDAAPQVNTRSITTKASELTRQYVTSAMADRFTRESENLKLDRLKLGDRGGSKAKHRHRPQLIGVSGSQRPVDILSEGEKTALGLAGLFTEVAFDSSKSALVLDDPVSSLDHERRKNVASRIADLSKDRQVIVFSHDLSFVGYLAKAAETRGVAVTERSIQRSGAREPGFIVENHPWKAKDVPKRLGDLEARLAKIKKECANWDEDTYLKETSSWAGDLSETLERVVRNDLIYPVVDRATTEVMPKMIKVLAQVTDQDNLEYQDIYSRVSEWAKRHDKSEDTNFVAPTHTELENELARVRAWFTRIKAYKNVK